MPVDTSDLDRFASVFSANFPGLSGLEFALERDYFDAGTSVLRSFLSVRIGTVVSHAQMVRTHPAFYSALVAGRDRFTNDPALIPRIRTGFMTLKEAYPNAWFAPTAFLVGSCSVGGTVINAGIAMAIELYSLNAQTTATAPSDFVRRNLLDPTACPPTVLHEAAHVQQALAIPFFNSANRTVLETALIEGGADVVARLCTGTFNSVTDEAWSLARESTLWLEFQRDMRGTDHRRWLYNQGAPSAGRPGDLGYFVGRRICEAYYARQSNKTQALRDMLTIQNAQDFLDRSGYAG